MKTSKRYRWSPGFILECAVLGLGLWVAIFAGPPVYRKCFPYSHPSLCHRINKATDALVKSDFDRVRSLLVPIMEARPQAFMQSQETMLGYVVMAISCIGQGVQRCEFCDGRQQHYFQEALKYLRWLQTTPHVRGDYVRFTTAQIVRVQDMLATCYRMRGQLKGNVI